MPSDATCAPSFWAGGANALHGCFLPNCGSGTSPAWQQGKPKFMPGFGGWSSSSPGTSFPSMSRPLSVNQSSFVRGSQSKPTLFRTPFANTSIAGVSDPVPEEAAPADFNRVIDAYGGSRSQMLQGAPTGT